MTTQRYQMIFSGKTADGFGKESVIDRLAEELGVHTTHLDPLFDGNRWLILDDVEFSVAKDYEDAFTRSGAMCEIESIDPAIVFETHTGENQGGEHLIFEKNHFAPLFFSGMHSQPVKDSKNKTIFYIEPEKPIIGRLAAILAGAAVALFLVIGFLPILMEWLLSISLNPVIFGICLYFTVIYLIYNLIAGRKRFYFCDEKEGETVFAQVSQHTFIKTGFYTWIVYDEEEKPIGKIKQDRHRKIYEAYDKDRAKLFTAQPFVDVETVATDAMLAIRERLFESKIFDVIQAFLEKSIKPLVGSMLDSEVYDAVEEWIVTDRDTSHFLIRDKTGRVVARCKIHNEDCQIEIWDQDFNDDDRQILITMGFLISGV